jgi:chromosome partitioning protein
MAKIIGLIQVKGGVGRSTVATNIAGLMALKNKTALIDCDMPQGTSASWFSARKQAGKTNNLTLATAVNHHIVTHDFSFSGSYQLATW